MPNSSVVGLIAAASLGFGSSVLLNLAKGHREEKTKLECKNCAKTVRPLEITSSGSTARKNVKGADSMSSKLNTTSANVQVRKQESFSAAVEASSSTELYDREVGVHFHDQSLPEDADSEHLDAVRKPHPYEDLRVGQRWREIQGENNWAGLLDPMDPILRGELTRYGDFAQATYDAFDHDSNSSFCGSCKFRKDRLFNKLSLENRGYEVTQYLYSTTDMHLPKCFKKPEWTSDNETWSKDSNWMGFVAVCVDDEEIARLGRRDILVAWRGTVTEFEWMKDIETSLLQCPTAADPRRRGKGSSSSKSVHLCVEKGFLSLYMSKKKESRYNKGSARDQVLGAIKTLMEKYEGDKLSITLTGHSMGGALAALCAYDIAESGINIYQQCPISLKSQVESHDDKSMAATAPELELPVHTNDGRSMAKIENDQMAGDGFGDTDYIVPITVFSFAAPRVGNNAFRDRVQELGVKVLRVVNVHDIVPTVPGLPFNNKLKFVQMHIPQFKECLLVRLVRDILDFLPFTYTHVGVELQLDNLHSPFLKPTRDIFRAHNLEAYLHLLDGFQGKSRGYSRKLSGRRDLALVNKQSDFLTTDHKIPSFWLQEKNKGLVRTEKGWFALHGREPEDIPRPTQHNSFTPFKVDNYKKVGC